MSVIPAETPSDGHQPPRAAVTAHSWARSCASSGRHLGPGLERLVDQRVDGRVLAVHRRELVVGHVELGGRLDAHGLVELGLGGLVGGHGADASDLGVGPVGAGLGEIDLAAGCRPRRTPRICFRWASWLASVSSATVTRSLRARAAKKAVRTLSSTWAVVARSVARCALVAVARPTGTGRVVPPKSQTVIEAVVSAVQRAVEFQLLGRCAARLPERRVIAEAGVEPRHQAGAGLVGRGPRRPRWRPGPGGGSAGPGAPP